MSKQETQATKPDFTRESDTDHTYGMSFRFYLGNDKRHTRWFATPEDGKAFAARNSITDMEFFRSESI